ncbi:hypothetical protein NGRA_2425 [Nosema granulosis]|uniref:Uncharacterized protein n=1 Tax=Nosema granulosis TaxID=83296 RepID=A0A9P6GXQ2_9MICR|nr:hypothetical protein NGRA_2425 [Nosema granulosis]
MLILITLVIAFLSVYTIYNFWSEKNKICAEEKILIQKVNKTIHHRKTKYKLAEDNDNAFHILKRRVKTHSESSVILFFENISANDTFYLIYGATLEEMLPFTKNNQLSVFLTSDLSEWDEKIEASKLKNIIKEKYRSTVIVKQIEDTKLYFTIETDIITSMFEHSITLFGLNKMSNRLQKFISSEDPAHSIHNVKNDLIKKILVIELSLIYFIFSTILSNLEDFYIKNPSESSAFRGTDVYTSEKNYNFIFGMIVKLGNLINDSNQLSLEELKTVKDIFQVENGVQNLEFTEYFKNIILSNEIANLLNKLEIVTAEEGVLFESSFVDHALNCIYIEMEKQNNEWNYLIVDLQ